MHEVLMSPWPNADACNDSPARGPSVIAVGAIQLGDDMASFSNGGECIDIMAPGVDVLSAAPGSPTATAYALVPFMYPWRERVGLLQLHRTQTLKLPGAFGFGLVLRILRACMACTRICMEKPHMFAV
jgi:hypothetical protein